MSVDERAVLAAANNADLYAAMFRAHGVPFERLPFAFVGHDRPPPFYSDMTVLSPDHDREILAEVEAAVARTGGPLGIKDSFDRLDLEPNGFEVLFTASWIWRPADGRPTPDGWVRVETGADLLAWETAWKANGSPTDHHMFLDALLDDPDLVFLSRVEGGRVVAGCLANRSPGVIGLSNVFAESPSDELFAEAATAAASTAPELPLVGYESGAELSMALAAGCTTVGGLRILVARAASFSS